MLTPWGLASGTEVNLPSPYCVHGMETRCPALQAFEDNLGRFEGRGMGGFRRTCLTLQSEKFTDPKTHLMPLMHQCHGTKQSKPGPSLLSIPSNPI